MGVDDRPVLSNFSEKRNGEKFSNFLYDMWMGWGVGGSLFFVITLVLHIAIRIGMGGTNHAKVGHYWLCKYWMDFNKTW